jgi:hypothetical protein
MNFLLTHSLAGARRAAHCSLQRSLRCALLTIEMGVVLIN